MIPRVTSPYVNRPSSPETVYIDGRNSARYLTNFLFLFLAVYAAAYGVTYAYLLHHLVNIVSAWLVAIHFSGSDLSFSGLTQILEDDEASGDVKKRP